MATLCIRVDDDVKDSANEVFSDLGLNMSTAVNMYLKYCVREKEIPFGVSSLKPSEELKRALKEADDISSGKTKSKAYDSAEEMMKDILGND